MMRNYRAWLPDHPEPDDFPIRSASPESAGKTFVMAHHDLSTLESALERVPVVAALKKRPQLVLVREQDSVRAEPHRIKVAADIEISVWGYPAEIDDPQEDA